MSWTLATYTHHQFIIVTSSIINILQVSAVTHEHALHHCKRAANKGGCSVWLTCDKTKLITLAVVDVLELYRAICCKSPILTYLTCIWHLHWGDPVWILPRSSASEKQSPWAIAWHCLHDPKFSHFSRTPTCDRQTDRYTHDYGMYRASMVSSGKNQKGLTWRHTNHFRTKNSTNKPTHCY